MAQQYKQVTGAASKLVLYPETTFKQPVAASGVLLHLAQESFADGVNKQQSAVIRNKRGPGKPFRGLLQLSGGVQTAADVIETGYILKALCGTSTDTAVTEKACSASAVTDKGDGRVGIPCAGHGFSQDTTISIQGSTSYDGTYRVVEGTTADEICIRKAYTAETMSSSVRILRGRVAHLTSVAEGGTDEVIFTCQSYHRLCVGDVIGIEGTTNYDDTDAVITRVVSGKKFAISATYSAETLTPATAIAVPAFTKHVWALPQYQPTVCFEKTFGFEDGAAETPTRRYLGCKISGLSFSLGGDAQLLMQFDVVPADVVPAADPLNDSPAELSSVALENIESSLFVDGERRGDVQTAEFSATFNIEQQAAVGDLGAYSRLPEGDPDISLSLTAFLEDGDLQKLVDDNASVQTEIVINGDSGDCLIITLPETELSSEGPKITGKSGLTQDFTVMAFVEDAASVLKFTSINRKASY